MIEYLVPDGLETFFIFSSLGSSTLNIQHPGDDHIGGQSCTEERSGDNESGVHPAYLMSVLEPCIRDRRLPMNLFFYSL